MTKIEATKWLKEQPEEIQELIKIVVLTTMDACEEMRCADESIPLGFPESAAYKAFIYEIVAHMKNKEYFDLKTKTWKTYGK